MPAITSIVAIIGKNREIGKNNKLIWNISEDMKRFKNLTQNHTVIMGRKTYESIGQKLENRNNIVISKNKNYQAKRCSVVYSIKEAIEYAQEMEKEEFFIIGGAQIYKQTLPYANKLYLTIVDQEADVDTFFPDYSQFENIVKKEEKETGDGLRFEFLELTKE